MKNKQKILRIFIFLILLASFVPNISAMDFVVSYHDYSNGNSPYPLSGVHPTADGFRSAMAFTFVPSQNCYAYRLMVQAYKTGSPAGYLRAEIQGVDAASLNSKPNGTVYARSINAYSMASLSADPDFSILSFNFGEAGDYPLSTTGYYAWVVYVENATLIDGSNLVKLNYKNTNNVAGYGSSYLNSAWGNIDATLDLVYYLTGAATIGDEPEATPTPSPSPSPTPFIYQGDIWVALSPYANILLPLVLIVFIALLCGKYGGVWGFFAGLNIAVILVYAIMGASYMPLWGLVMLALVDGLLLFGKISGRM